MAPDVSVVILDVDPMSSPSGKLAEAELVFTAGSLAGLRLVGFSLWAPRVGGQGRINVTFPARQYSVNGERRSFAIVRPAEAVVGRATTDGLAAQERLCDRLRAAYEAHVCAPKEPR